MRFSIAFAALAFAGVAFGQYNSGDAFYQLGYAANLNIGDSVVNVTNDGINGGVSRTPWAQATSA